MKKEKSDFERGMWRGAKIALIWVAIGAAISAISICLAS